MTDVQITVDGDLADTFSAIAAAYAGQKAQVAAGQATITDLQADVAGDVSQLADDASTIAALQAQVAQLQLDANPMPPVGAYLGDQSSVTAFGPDVNVLRQYNTPGKIPATFVPMWPLPHLKITLPSIKPDHPTFDQDAVVATYAHSYAAWCKAHGVRPIIIIEHEPENKTKQPADSPTNFSAEWIHYRNVIKIAEPDLEVWATFMTYTEDERPPDNLGHATKGVNEWIDELHAETVAAAIAPDGISFDGYPDYTKGETAEANFGPDFAYVRAKPGWSRMPVGVAEWGYGDPIDVNTEAHITAGLDYFRQYGVEFISYFDANVSGQWNLAGRPLSIKALQAAMTAG